MRILVCDDEQGYVETIMNQIEKCKDGDLDHEIDGISDIDQLLIQVKLHRYDIAFLDVELGKVTGVEIAELLMEKNPECLIVFITNYRQYVNDAIDLHVIRYLYKDEVEEKFKGVYDKVIETFKKRQVLFTFNTSEGKERFSPYQIQYIETYYNNLKICTSTRSYFSNIKNASNIKKALKPYDFFQVHQSFFVNLHYVYSIESDTLT